MTLSINLADSATRDALRATAAGAGKASLVGLTRAELGEALVHRAGTPG